MSNKTIHTNKRYLALAAVFVLLGLGVLFLPEKDNKKELEPHKLLVNLNDNSRLISTDDVSDRIINNDPTLLLIDVRTVEEYDLGTLPGAMHIPLNEILSENALNVFSRKAYDKVLFSNNDVLSEQAWMLLARNLVERTFIMKGGLNEWVRTIINPVEPKASAPIEEFELYNLRLAAGRYFTGQSKAFEYIDFESAPKKSSSRSTTGTIKKTPAPALPPPPAEEEEEEEGC